MKTSFNLRPFLTVVAGMCLLLSSCSNEEDNNLPIEVSSVALDHDKVQMTEGDTLTLKVTIEPENAANKNVSWFSNNEDVATVSEGKVTAVQAGNAVITVIAEDGGMNDECAVSVTPKVYPVESVSLDRTEYEMTEGDTATLVATIKPDNATNKNVSWSSSDESIATISDEGMVTAIKAGTAVITVTTEDGNKTAECSITITSKVYPVESVSLDRTEYEMTEGDTATLVATIKPDNATNKNVSWSSSDESIATVSDEGKVTAIKAGTAVITVTTEDGNKTAECSITITSKVYPVESVSLDRTEYEMTEGDTATLVATIKPDNATNKNVSWSSSDESIATVSGEGMVTAIKAGTAVITVTTEDGGKTAGCSITVIPKVYPVESVSLDKTGAELNVGDMITLTATVLPENATNKNIFWSSSKPDVASVEDGRVTALLPGESIITVTTEDGNKTAQCIVSVLEIPVESVSLDKTELELTEGDQGKLTASVLPENATNKRIQWHSSDESIATVNEGIVTAVSPGNVMITAISESGGKVASCDVTVNARIYPVTGVTINKSTLKMMTGDEETLTAIIKPDNATNKNVTWSSSDESIVSVTSDGRVTAVSEGEAAITVTTEDGSMTAQCNVTVSNNITEYVSADYYGGSISSVNDLIQYGSQLYFGLSNSTSNKTITAKSVQLIDGKTMNEGNVMEINSDIEAGTRRVWKITVGLLGIHDPIARFVYIYEGVEYQVEAHYIPFSPFSLEGQEPIPLN